MSDLKGQLGGLFDLKDADPAKGQKIEWAQ